MMSRTHFVRAILRSFAVCAILCVLSVHAGAQAAAQRAAVPQTPAAPAPPAPKMPAMQGQEIDRVVAIVNGDLILDSDVDEERRFTAFQAYRDPEGITRATRRSSGSSTATSSCNRSSCGPTIRSRMRM
jgi:peptidyl-prolyl cis-trans isomerase SurA